MLSLVGNVVILAIVAYILLRRLANAQAAIKKLEKEREHFLRVERTAYLARQQLADWFGMPADANYEVSIKKPELIDRHAQLAKSLGWVHYHWVTNEEDYRYFVHDEVMGEWHKWRRCEQPMCYIY